MKIFQSTEQTLILELVLSHVGTENKSELNLFSGGAEIEVARRMELGIFPTGVLVFSEIDRVPKKCQ